MRLTSELSRACAQTFPGYNGFLFGCYRKSKEVRFFIDTYFRPEGRFTITAGNAITADCKVESYHALLDEAYHYGLIKVAEI